MNFISLGEFIKVFVRKKWLNRESLKLPRAQTQDCSSGRGLHVHLTKTRGEMTYNESDLMPATASV
jgi:hypothetical protein